MAQGRIVFDGAPQELTDAAARELYGIEAGEVLEPAEAPLPVGQPALA
jgi:phosphonate transport system ATP-binding protein